MGQPVRPGGAVAALALLLASLSPIRWPTVALVGAGTGDRRVIASHASPGQSLTAVRFRRGAALLAAGVLLLAVFAPGVLNSRWVLDAPVADLRCAALVVVRHDRPDDAGRPLSEDGGADANTEGFRQDDLFVRIDSVKAGRLPERGTTPYLLVNLYLTQLRPGRPATFEGHAPSCTEPTLTDEAGRSYAFVVDRVRANRPNSTSCSRSIICWSLSCHQSRCSP